MSTLIIDKHIPVSLYYQLKNVLRKYIAKNSKPHEKFFSERQLAEKYKTSRITTGRAINDLVSEGLLYRIQGKGTFVADFNERVKTNNIGFILAQRLANLSGGTVNPESLHEVESACKAHGYHLFFFMAEEKFRKDKELPKMVSEKKVDGLILVGDIEKSLIKTLNGLLPVVLLDHYIEGEEIDSVMADNVEGAYNAVKYLLELGHRNIGFIYGPFTAPSFRERLTGYKKALSEYKVRFRKSLLCEGGPHIDDGYRAMKSLLSLPKIPAAIFASNDTMALGAMKAIKDKGMNIPKNISIVGFDDKEFAAYASPPLTTVKVNNKAMAEEIVERLIEKIREDNAEPKKITVPTELIIRESCKKCSGLIHERIKIL